ncbi:hypothetical protein UlMin_006325 [Ulmus minor]
MKKLRWVIDGGGFWEVDMSSPATVDGLARPVPGDTFPLGLSRGARLSRPKQIDFMQRFMSTPFLPSYSSNPSNGGDGFVLQRVLTIPFAQNWFSSVLGQFNLQKFVSAMKSGADDLHSSSSSRQIVGRHLKDKSLYAIGFCSEFLLSPDDTLLLSLDRYLDKDVSRKKAVFHHKFPHHDLTMEAVSPGLFLDKAGNYWDVPFLVALDLASVGFDSGVSYHLSIFYYFFWVGFRGDAEEVKVGDDAGEEVKGWGWGGANIAIYKSRYYKISISHKFFYKCTRYLNIFVIYHKISLLILQNIVIYHM